MSKASEASVELCVVVAMRGGHSLEGSEDWAGRLGGLWEASALTSSTIHVCRTCLNFPCQAVYIMAALVEVRATHYSASRVVETRARFDVLDARPTYTQLGNSFLFGLFDSPSDVPVEDEQCTTSRRIGAIDG